MKIKIIIIIIIGICCYYNFTEDGTALVTTGYYKKILVLYHLRRYNDI